jgi:NADH dehydrogenase
VAQRLAITGANGAVGRAIVRLALAGASLDVVALVRSERAAAQVPPIPEARGEVRLIDWAEPATLEAALAGAHALVHLPGVLVERPDSTYEAANVDTTRAAISAARAAGVGKLVIVSAIGADASAANRFFRTKGVADALVCACGLPYTILRTPLLLGPGTEGSRALRRECSRPSCWLIAGGRTLHRPLDVDDLARAVVRAAREPELARDRTLDLAGPEPLRYRELVERAASALGSSVRVRALPATPLRWLLALRARLAGPGFSPDALEVLLSDTRVDPEKTAAELDVRLTPLDATIRRSLEEPAE